MKTLVKYAWPVLVSMALQIFILTTVPVKPGWLWVRIGLFAVVDTLIALVQGFRFERDQRVRQDLEAIRRRLRDNPSCSSGKP